MSDLPAEAVQAAAAAISRMLFSGQPEYGTWMEHDDDLARAAVEAAAPFIAEQARREVVAHIREIAERGPCGYTNAKAFIERHERLHAGDGVVAVLLAVADEIEGAGHAE